ncbi:S-layer homology domain-containing protein [Allocoleopsis franciscana]|uniref:Putative S-layer protein n=1 Tax=Allocoleopsis franciscana PCC 7113 TaxID=1173027 RepID=K9WLI9_9CYAN|nr:S-layer homology domain-containing protein [Allocoleopsis franciscana]AFZ20666.1 putative S-layer protein [Allocoleopsis franciscana PCC 7113]
MSRLSAWNSGSSTLLVLGLAVGATAPIVMSAPATAANFVDIQRHWAQPFIEALAQENLINGFSDQTFRPDQPVTRAQFAAMIQQAFDENNVQLSREFDEAAADYWISRDLDNNSSSNRQLRLSDPLSRGQVLAALADGLGLSPRGSADNILNFYRDASQIPRAAREPVAAATQQGIVVNYPDVSYLDPMKTATRADVAAFIYQALANEGVLAPISNRTQAFNYIVRVNSGTNQAINNRSNNQTITNNRNTRTAQYKVARGTPLNVEYPQSDQIILAPGETRNLTLVVAEDIKNSQGEIVIPRNSEIEGQIVPRYSGSQFLGAQFVAQRLMIGGESYNNINVTSSLLTAQQPEAPKPPRSLGDAALSVLTGVLTGRSSTANQQQKPIVIDPSSDLQLTVGSDFYVNSITPTSMPSAR